MKSAEVALVTIVPDGDRVVMPSKTYSAMAAGQAVLAIAPKNSDLAKLIAKHDCGWVVPPGDPEGFAAAVKEITENREELQGKRQNALDAAREYYDVRNLAGEWKELFGELKG